MGTSYKPKEKFIPSEMEKRFVQQQMEFIATMVKGNTTEQEAWKLWYDLFGNRYSVILTEPNNYYTKEGQQLCKKARELATKDKQEQKETLFWMQRPMIIETAKKYHLLTHASWWYAPLPETLEKEKNLLISL